MWWRPSTPLPQLVAAIRRVARVVPGAAEQIAELCAHVAACSETGIITGAPGGQDPGFQCRFWHGTRSSAPPAATPPLRSRLSSAPSPPLALFSGDPVQAITRARTHDHARQ